MLEGRKGTNSKKSGYQGKTHRFDFVIFKNYDGTKTGKAIPREVYKKLFNQNVQLSATNGII